MYLTQNKFDNFTDGLNKDGEVNFRPNSTFTVWDEFGKWKLIDTKTLETTLNGKSYTFKFNKNATEATLIYPLLGIRPGKMVI